jgi:hypothetical protein|tara:strand:- start:2362 stop:3030 length:669 start_codon:yes stop_codon:yes gene_type:complete
MIRLFAALAATLLTGSAASAPLLPAPTPEAVQIQFEDLTEAQQLQTVSEALRPLLDEIVDAEGGEQACNAVNRGWAGDTPGGARSVLGRDLTSMTISEVIEAQRWHVFAVGCYQFIPKTLGSLVLRSDFDQRRLFTRRTQQDLAVLLIKFHRPTVWRYLQGERVSTYQAALSLSKEWASLPHPADGRSYYAGRSGNAAKVSRPFVLAVISEARGTLTQPLEI